MSTDSDSTSSVIGFKRLDDTNYNIWVQRMTDALAKKKYWRHAQGTEEKHELDPTSVYADTVAGKSAQAKAQKAIKKELNEWEDDDGTAAAPLRSISTQDGEDIKIQNYFGSQPRRVERGTGRTTSSSLSTS